jgi:hypothetical protein
MTNTAIKDFDPDIMDSNLSSPDRKGIQRGSRALCGVGFYAHDFMIIAAFGWFKMRSCAGQPSTAPLGSVWHSFFWPGLLGPLVSFDLHFHKLSHANCFRMLVFPDSLALSSA